MSYEFAIEVINLGKCYQIYDKPSDRLKQMLFRGRRQYYKEFWALKNVSFSVKKGETVGIIGRNGSGKSTLLQMICGTLNPTAGQVKVNGKVAALLELGAGFNPEFTGVENVYMAASLYGLTKEEVDQRFAAITEFADIGDHINQPVKTYSSGMYVRLAFAVIAHVDAEVLVIDEALAVGDAIFSQKCMRFIRKFKENGTIIFVSHDLSSVLNLCERAIWLHAGKLEHLGQAKEISEAYLQFTLQEIYGLETQLHPVSSEEGFSEVHTPPVPLAEQPMLDYHSQLTVKNNLNEANGWKTGSGEITLVKFELIEPTFSHGPLKGGEMVKVTVEAIAYEDMLSPILGFLVRDRLGQDLFGENTMSLSKFSSNFVSAGQYLVGEFTFKLPMLPNGHYTVMTSFADGDLHENVQHHLLHDSIHFYVDSSLVRYGLVGLEFNKINLKIGNEGDNLH